MAAKPTAMLMMAIRWMTAENPAAEEVIRLEMNAGNFNFMRLTLKDRQLKRNSIHDQSSNIFFADNPFVQRLPLGKFVRSKHRKSFRAGLWRRSDGRHNQKNSR